MMQCWELETSLRPTFGELEQFFERISGADNVADYI